MHRSADGLSGDELRALRRRVGLTQAALADRLGVSPNTVARWERGTRRMANPVLVRQSIERLEPASNSDILSRRDPPAPLTRFIGRKAEVDHVRAALRETRLLTLIGTGGVGKTRLALEVTLVHAGDVRWVDLAPVAVPELIPEAVASAVGIRADAQRPALEHLAETLRSRQLLLLLDNCEHVAAGCAEVALHLLRACPEMRILATSRQPLGVPGERLWRVPPLSMPDLQQKPVGEAEAAGCEAVQLLVDRAQALQPDFHVTSDNATALVEVCRRLGGIPLALELAAARLQVLSPHQLLELLGTREGLLPAGGVAQPARQQTLRATFDWSYTLLSGAEQELFDQLGVFSNGWTLQLAEQICGTPPNRQSTLLDGLRQLVAQSLVLAETDGREMRFRLLEPLREYALDHLREFSDAAQLRRRHLASYAKLAAAAEPQFWRADHAVWFRRFDREIGNVRAALDWSLSDDATDADAEAGLRLVAALWRYWDLRGQLAEAHAWVERLLARVAYPCLARAAGLTVAGYYAAIRGHPSALSTSLAALELARDLGDTQVLLDSLMLGGLVAVFTGQMTGAAALWEETLAFGGQQNSPVHVGSSYYWLAELARLNGEIGRATTLFEHSLTVARQLGSVWSEAYSLESLGQIALRQGELGRAEELLRRGFELRLGLDDARGVPWSIEELGWVAAARGHAERAVKLLGLAKALSEHIGMQLPAAWLPDHEQAVRIAQRQLGGPVFDRAWEECQALGQSPQEAVDYALASAQQRSGPSGSPLSPREWEVARLIATGLSNRLIAERLVIGKTTVDRHVSNVLAKLGASSRAQVAAWVGESARR